MFFSFGSRALWRVVMPLVAIVLLQASLSAGSLRVMSAVRAYIGLVRLEDCATVQDALRVADVACFLAKDKGRNSVQLHRPSDADMAIRVAEMSWVQRIRKGLDEDRPVAATGKSLVRRELLLRLRDESGNLVSPASFLLAAERYGLMPLTKPVPVLTLHESMIA